jgi:starch phosphorylase
VGWAIGDGHEHGDDPAWDAAEAEALYSLLEREIVPEFYQRNDAGVPAKWVSRMRESMARLTPEYSANRVVRQYTENYVAAATAYTARADQRGKLGVEVLAWQQKVAAEWSGVYFGSLKVESKGGLHHFEIPVHFGGLGPDAVRVELFADGRNGEEPMRKPMDRGAQLPANGFLYSTSVKDNRSASDFTPRVVPYHPSARVPLEASQILWQK